VIGVRGAVRRCSRGRDDGLLVDRERCIAGPGERKQISHRLDAARRGCRVASPLADTQGDVLDGCDPGQELRPVHVGEPDLEARCARAGQRPATENSTASVRAAAAASPRHAKRRAGQWPAGAVYHPSLPEHVERCLLSGDVQLVPHRPGEGALPVGQYLASYVELPEGGERSTCNTGARDVEVERELAMPSQMNTAGGMEQRRDLGKGVAPAPGRERDELVANVFGEGQSAPSCSRRRRLYATPSEP
jgi:hypothetical protein